MVDKLRNTASAEGDQEKGLLEEVRVVRGAATEL